MGEDHHSGLHLEADAAVGQPEHGRPDARLVVLQRQIAVALYGDVYLGHLAFDPDILKPGLLAEDLLDVAGQVGDLEDLHQASSAGCAATSPPAMIRPSTPLTNRPDSSPPKVLASSIDSLTAAL